MPCFLKMVFFCQFGGFSAESLADRILDARARVVITADGVWRGDKMIHLKEITDQVLYCLLFTMTLPI